MEDFKDMEDLRQCEQWGKHIVKQGMKMIDVPAEDGIHTIKGIILPMGMLGLSILKIQRADYDPNWEELKKIRKENWVATSIIEPTKVQDLQAYKMAGYKISNMPYLATKTVILDLRPSKETLWKSLTENAKRLIRKNSDLVITEVSPIEFLENWKRWAKIWTIKLDELNHLKMVFGDKVSFLIGKKDGINHSGLITIRTSDMVFYYHTWTSDVGRQSGSHYKLVWEELLRGKKEGAGYFDFEGIYDPRWPQKKWIGFTEFKKKFGGEIKTCPGCFCRWF